MVVNKELEDQLRVQRWAAYHCQDCGSKTSECMCAEKLGQTEESIRFHKPVPERIDEMIGFVTALHGSLPGIGAEGNGGDPQYNVIMERGKTLQKQHAVIKSKTGTGMLTGKLVHQHIQAVNEWLSACDAYNASLCSVVGKPMGEPPLLLVCYEAPPVIPVE
jgi:hypothetical protein